MENQAIIDLLTNTSNQINSIMTGPGAMIQFSSASGSMNPLKDALIDVLNKFLDKQVKIADSKDKKKYDKENKDAEKRAKKLIEEQQKIIKGIIDKKEQSDKISAGTLTGLAKNSLAEMKSGNKASLSGMEKFLGYSARGIEITKDLFDVTKKIYKVISQKVFENIDFANDLREAGVLIKEGFDEGFIKYVTMSGKDREAFIKLAQENSRTISSMNGAGMNGLEVLAKESKKLTGVLGLSTKEIDASIKYHNASLLTAANQADIATMDHEEVLLKSTKALKMFAFETGQSYENLLKERREREKTWQMQRLANDPRTKDQFLMLRNMGMSDEQIEAIMLGKANKASVMAHLDSDSAAMFQSIQHAYRTSKGNPEAFSRSLAKISNSGAANNLRRKSANVNIEDMAYLSEDMGVIMDPSLQWGKFVNERLNEGGEEKMYDKEANTLNDIQKINADINRAQVRIANAMIPSLETTAKHLPSIRDNLEKLANYLEKHPGAATAAGWITNGASILTTIAGSIAPFIMWKAGGLLFKGTKGIFKGIWKGGAAILGKAMSKSIKAGVKAGVKEGAKAGAKASAKAVSKAVTKKAAKEAVKAGIKAGAKAGAKTAGKAVGKAAGKSLLKKIPLIGLGAGLIFGAGRALSGDWTGALGEVASGAASTIPGIGTAASVAIDAGLAARDIHNAMNEPANADESSEYNTESQQAKGAKENPSAETQEGMCQCVSVENITTVEDLLNSINENTKALLNEFKSNGFNVGTNMCYN